LEAPFQADFPDYRVLWTDRATSALFTALSVIRENYGDGDIIIPDTVCPNVPLAVLYTGFRPVFCDVEPDTFCLSVRTVLPHLTSKTRAVVAVHLFGKSAPVAELLTAISGTGIRLIEDCAQSFGGSIGGRQQGSFADFTVLSFSRRKTLDGDFGALLVRNSSDFDTAQEIEKRLPSPADPLPRSELAQSFRDLTMGAFDLLRSQEVKFNLDLLVQFADYYRPLYLAQFVPVKERYERMSASYSNLKRQRTERYERYRTYLSCFSTQVEYIPFDPEEVIWRLPILLPSHSHQLKLLNHLRANRVFVSNHYFPISTLFGATTAPTARRIGLCALNLWVDSASDLDKIRWSCEQINEAIAL
jgi:dTDP-4-amino-4,6-dideoxygalactose transaminase